MKFPSFFVCLQIWYKHIEINNWKFYNITYEKYSKYD